MSVFRKAAVYLGLVDDEDDEVYEYEEYGDAHATAPAERAPAAEPPVRAVPRAPEPAQSAVTVVRPMRPEPVDDPEPRPASPVVRPAPRVHVLEPHGFNDAQEIGDRLKSGQPVITNLQGLDRELQRRLIDFASGLCYALGGTMSKAADQVFLLTPPNVEVPDDEKERLRDRGLYRR